MSVVQEFQKANNAYALSFSKGNLPMPPARHVAVLTCMDARLLPARFLGLEEGMLMSSVTRVDERAMTQFAH
jgi:carbonic anhydrase